MGPFAFLHKREQKAHANLQIFFWQLRLNITQIQLVEFEFNTFFEIRDMQFSIISKKQFFKFWRIKWK